MAQLTDRLLAVVGGRSAKPLSEHLGIDTVGDLLQHYPRRYETRGQLTDLAELVPGEQATIIAEVRSVRTVGMGGRGRSGRTRGGLRVEATLTDGVGSLAVTFFNQPWRAKDLRPGRRGLFSGKVGEYRGKLQLANPQCHFVDDADDAEAAEIFARELIPVYPATGAVASTVIARTVKLALQMLDPVADPMPPQVLAARSLMDFDTALRTIHQPDDQQEARQARRRLAYDEALVLQSVLARRRHHAAGLLAAPRPAVPDGIAGDFDGRLPFPLTAGQEDVGRRIADDLASAHPMHRLLQGDVGSGKTLVALRAILQVVDAGGQAVLLAPTEVLAQQHHTNMIRMLGPLAQGGLLGGADHGTRVALLTGSTPAAVRRRVLLEIATGEAGIIVGTHALLQDSVQYADLGLIVVDEQHRFGVEQRSALLERIPGERPHLLVMTATPIPRTVAMTVFGDLDVSTLTERPAGESRVVSHVVAEREQPSHIDRAWQRVAEEVAAGRQVFIVCPRISDSDDEAAGTGAPDDPAAPPAATHAVMELAAELAAGPLSGLRIGVLHGRLAPQEKDAVMRRFAAGPADGDGVDVLVSTTVIEVGVDIAGAAMMVVMDADRFGVSQLHQLRGRVGRAGQPALCLLMTQAETGSAAHARLLDIAATNDGFELARLDLEQRREGDVLGAAQSGRRSSLRLLSVLRDGSLIEMARDDASAIVAADPDLIGLPLLREAVVAAEAAATSEYLEKA